MTQDNPARAHRRDPGSRSSTYEYSTAGVPYRPLQLTRHPVVMAGAEAPVMRGVWKRLLLLVVMAGFGAMCVHGGVARRLISWMRLASGEDGAQRVAFEAGR